MLVCIYDQKQTKMQFLINHSNQKKYKFNTKEMVKTASPLGLQFKKLGENTYFGNLFIKC